jgi:AraC family transcriptional activator of mtrCDE
MQALDRLIQLSRVQGALDLRCLFRGPVEIDHAPEPLGVAAYHIVLDGECALRRPGFADTQLRAGDIALLTRGDAHVIGVAGNAPPHAMQSHFNGALTVRSNHGGEGASLDLLCGRFEYATPALLIDALPDFIHLSMDDAALAALVATMRRESEEVQAGAQSIVSALSTALFTMILRAWLTRDPSLGGVLALLANRRVGQAVIAMLEKPAEAWTLERLASLAAMSRATFVRAFSALIDDTPLVLLGKIRMQLASRLLTHSTKSIDDVAAEVGYQSEAAFSKKFKETFGVAPGRFRQGNGLA